mgnify:CR=1 FL=1
MSIGSGCTGGSGTLSPSEKAATARLLEYVKYTQRGATPALQAISQAPASATMAIDAASRASLEITRTANSNSSSNSNSGASRSLLSLLRHTHTSAGGRLLSARLSAPLTDVAAIDARLETVDLFRRDEEGLSLSGEVGDLLKGCGDMERALQRLALGRGGPRDLVCLASALRKGSELLRVLEPVVGARSSGGAWARTGTGARRALDIPFTEDPLAASSPSAALLGRLGAALVKEPRANVSDGGFIRAGYHAELDQWRSLSKDASAHVKQLESRYRELTGAPNGKLSVKHNFILGYFVEVRTAGWDIESCEALALSPPSSSANAAFTESRS